MDAAGDAYFLTGETRLSNTSFPKVFIISDGTDTKDSSATLIL